MTDQSTTYYKFVLWTSTSKTGMHVEVEIQTWSYVRIFENKIVVKNVETGQEHKMNPNALYPFASPTLKEAMAVMLYEHKRPHMLLDIWEKQIKRLAKQAIADHFPEQAKESTNGEVAEPKGSSVAEG